MNREILFKAKRIDNGEWVEGYVVRYGYNKKEKWYIVPEYASDLYAFEIDETTICQYTGLFDKNGNKIWENDVIGYWDTYSTENGLAEADCIGKVFWDDETLSFQVTERLSAESYEVMDECSVIGNIFDNLELLKGSEEEWVI
jgi:uncharacterized phage protein (TIGR01671 family)